MEGDLLARLAAAEAHHRHLQDEAIHACNLAAEWQAQVTTLRKMLDEGAVDMATEKTYGHTLVPNLTLKLLKERAGVAEAELNDWKRTYLNTLSLYEQVKNSVATLTQERDEDSSTIEGLEADVKRLSAALQILEQQWLEFDRW